MISKVDNGDHSDKVGPGEHSRDSTRPASKDVTPSIVSANLKIVGKLITEGELQIDGTVEGDVNCKQLTVGESAVVSGEITADEVEVHGRVEGQIKARSVHVKKTARVVGDIWHDSLSMEAGAFLDVYCRRNNGTISKAATGQPVTAEHPQA